MIINCGGKRLEVKRITKRQLAERLEEAAATRDAEAAHWKADLALIAYIYDPAVTRAWERVKKWYA